MNATHRGCFFARDICSRHAVARLGEDILHPFLGVLHLQLDSAVVCCPSNALHCCLEETDGGRGICVVRRSTGENRHQQSSTSAQQRVHRRRNGQCCQCWRTGYPHRRVDVAGHVVATNLIPHPASRGPRTVDSEARSRSLSAEQDAAGCVRAKRPPHTPRGAFKVEERALLEAAEVSHPERLLDDIEAELALSLIRYLRGEMNDFQAHPLAHRV